MFDNSFRRFNTILSESTIKEDVLDGPSKNVSIEDCKTASRELMAASMKASNVLLSYTLANTQGNPESTMTGDISSKVQKLLVKLEKYIKDIDNPEKLAAVSQKSPGASLDEPGEELDMDEEDTDALDQGDEEDTEDLSDEEAEELGESTINEDLDYNSVKVGDHVHTYRLLGGRTISGKVLSIDGDILTLLPDGVKLVKISRDQLEHISPSLAESKKVKPKTKKKVVKKPVKKGKKTLKESEDIEEEIEYKKAEPIIGDIINQKIDAGIESNRLGDDDMVVEIATETMEALNLPPSNEKLAMYMEFTQEAIHTLNHLFQRDLPSNPGIFEAKTIEEARQSTLKDLDMLIEVV